MINVIKKAGSYLQCLADIKGMGKVILETAYLYKSKEGHRADVSGQEGKRLYDIKTDSKTWLLGADTIAKALLETGFELSGCDGTVKVKREGKASVSMTDLEFERDPLCSAIADAYVRQAGKAEETETEEDIESDITE